MEEVEEVLGALRTHRHSNPTTDCAQRSDRDREERERYEKERDRERMEQERKENRTGQERGNK